MTQGTSEPIFTGGCACGAVRFEVSQPPLRVGLCHCMTCRRKHGSAFNPFVVFKAEDVLVAGALRAWRSSEHASRFSCETCASPICQQEDEGGEIELHLGSFDDTSLFPPMYENWIVYRESWLPYLDVPQRKTDLGYMTRQAKKSAGTPLNSVPTEH